MRLGAPFICFLVTVFLRWVSDVDLWGVTSDLPPEAIPFVQAGTGIAVWLSAAWLATALFGKLVLRITQRRGIKTKLPKLLIDVGAIVIFFSAGLLIVTHVFGQPIVGVLATSGVLAAFIGFSVQKTIADVAAGIGLSLEQSIKLGDWIELSTGAIGKATEMTWRTTYLETIQGHTIVVPNSLLSGGQFTNLSAPERYLRFTKTISIDYNIPTDRVIQILEAAMRATAGVLAQPAPQVRVDNCGASGVLYNMYHWVADYPENFLVSSEVLVNALNFLDQAGITPVYPKTDITLFRSTPRRIDRHIDLAAILRRTPFFARVDDQAVQSFEHDGQLREFSADSIVVQEGNAGTSLFVVIAGLLDVSKQVAGGPARRVARLEPGDVFGEMSLLTGAARSATVTAATQATVLEIDKQQIEPVLARQPELVAAFGQLIAERAAANESVLAAWPEERHEIATLGLTAFVMAKIMSFFDIEPT